MTDTTPRDLAKTPDSLKKRYIYKIVANIFGIFSNLLVQAIAPRSLGPVQYGNFNFLTQFFDNLTETIDGRSSSGALVKASIRPAEVGLAVFYFYYAIAGAIAVFLGIYAMNAYDITNLIWPEQELQFIYLAAMWGILVWYHGILHKLCDAYGLTIEAEKLRALQKILSGGLIAGLFVLDKISLVVFFYYYIFVLLFLFVGFIYILSKHKKWPQFHEWFLPFQKIVTYSREYYHYCAPLFVFVAAESLVTIFDRWLLQNFSGSEEQGYFGFAFQIGYISVLFVGTIAPLFQREFSVAHDAKNYDHMSYLYRRYMPILFSVGMYFSAFICFQAENIIHLFAGKRFINSMLPIVLMAFFPAYQTFGRLTASVFFATGQTRQYRNVSLTVLAVGMILSWVLLSTPELGGLHLGALGLAIKLLITYVLLVNIQMYFNAKLLKVKYRLYLFHQVSSFLAFMVMSFIATFLVDGVFKIDAISPAMAFFIAGVIYTALVLLLLYAVPGIGGIYRTDFDYFLKRTVPGKKSEAIDMLQIGRDIKNQLPKKKLRLAVLGARSSIHTVRWANAMVELGHEVHLISMHRGGDKLHPDVKEYYLSISAPLGYFLNAFSLRKILRAVQPDIFHVHYISGYGTLGSLSGSKPYVLSVWGSDIYNFPYFSLFNETLIRYNLRKADWVCSTSHVMAAQTIRIFPEVKHKISVTPFGIDVDRFKPNDVLQKNDYVVGTVKTLMDKYGIDTLIEGFALAKTQLTQLYPDVAEQFKLVIVGGGRQEKQLKQLVQTLGVQDAVHFAGYVPHHEVPNFLSQFDLYVAVSREDSESFGVAIIEASAFGLPVIVSNVGGLPEVVEDGVTGWVVPKDSPNELADKIVEMVLNRRMGLQMGENGRRRVKDMYEWRNNVNQMEEVYLGVLHTMKGVDLQ